MLNEIKKQIQKDLKFTPTQGGMNVTNTSLFSGKTRTVYMPITQEQVDRWRNGELIQNAFPHLTPSQREFILTGATDAEWDTLK